MKDKIEEAWLARWKSELGNPSKKPRRIMKAYIDYLDSTVTLSMSKCAGNAGQRMMVAMCLSTRLD
jgi:hypothetical protein